MIEAIKSLFKKIFGDISSGTIIRTVCFFLAIINQILQDMGKSPIPITDAQIQTIVSTMFIVITGLIAWWKNNSFTPAAIAGDARMKQIKGK